MSASPTPSPEFQALIDQITSNESVEDSAVAVINTLADKVTSLASQLAASPQKDQLLALAAAAKAHADPLAAAVVANTEAAPSA